MKKCLLLPCMAAVMWGYDLSGTWSGVIEVADASSGTRINTPVKAELQQKADSVSGKIGRREGSESEAIRNGKVEGDTVRFEVTSPETSGAMRFQLRLVESDRLEGDMKGTVDTGSITGKVRLTKQK